MEARAQDENHAQLALRDEAQPVEGANEMGDMPPASDPLEPSAEEMRRVRLQRFGLATSGDDPAEAEDMCIDPTWIQDRQWGGRLW
eukprot:COSAG02_NODE_92_length_37588_cov_135.916242_3_plen_86_part_00